MKRDTPMPSRSPIAISIALAVAVILIVWSGFDRNDRRVVPADRTATANAAVDASAGVTVRFFDATGAVLGGCIGVEADWGFNAVCDGDDTDRSPEPGTVAMPFFGPDDPSATDPDALLSLYPPPGYVPTGEPTITIAFARSSPLLLDAEVEALPASPVATPE